MWSAYRRLPLGSRLLVFSIVSCVVSSLTHIAATCILSTVQFPDESPEILTVTVRSEQISIQGSSEGSIAVASPAPVPDPRSSMPDKPQPASVAVRQATVKHLPDRLERKAVQRADSALPNERARKAKLIAKVPENQPAPRHIDRKQAYRLDVRTQANVDRAIALVRGPEIVPTSSSIEKQGADRQPTESFARREMQVAVRKSISPLPLRSALRNDARRDMQAAINGPPTSKVERHRVVPRPNASTEARIPEKSIASRSASATTTPRLLGQTPPSYPVSLRRQGIEGKVLLSVEVDETGAVVKVTVKKSSGYVEFDESAMETVRLWRFDPAKRGRKPVKVRVYLPVVFRIVR